MTTRPSGSPGGGWYTKKLNATSLSEKFSKCRMLGKNWIFQKHDFFANWAILSEKKNYEKKFFPSNISLNRLPPRIIWVNCWSKVVLWVGVYIVCVVPTMGNSNINAIFFCKCHEVVVQCVTRCLGCERSKVQCHLEAVNFLTYFDWLKEVAKLIDT